MITGLIHVARTADPALIDRLADTLGTLVEGVAAGLVGDAVIVTAEASAQLATLAEGCGATLVVRAEGTDAWQAGAEAARRGWLLCLAPGDLPAEGWVRTLDRYVGTAPSAVELARLRRPHAGLIDRLAARAERVVGAVRPRPGDLVRRDRLVASVPFTTRLKPHPVPARLDVV